jgi:hypothetical protein
VTGTAANFVLHVHALMNRERRRSVPVSGASRRVGMSAAAAG